MLNIAIDGLDEVQSKLSSYSSALVNAIGDRSDALAAALAEKVRSDKLAGGVLSSRTGALTASIFADVITNSDSVSAAVGSSGVPYAAIQEYGGKTAAHEIVPDKARALAFVGGGEMRFARRVEHPGSILPERSYLRSSLAEFGPEISEQLAAAIGAVWSEA